MLPMAVMPCWQGTDDSLNKTAIVVLKQSGMEGIVNALFNPQLWSTKFTLNGPQEATSCLPYGSK